MFVVYDDTQSLHAPQTRLTGGTLAPALEVPERAGILLQAALDAGCRHKSPADRGDTPIRKVHTLDYLTFLRSGFAEWARMQPGSAEMRASLHANAYMARPPRSLLGRAGLYLSDAASVLTEGSWQAIYASAQTALEGAALIVAGERAAYALCRPPGHHAYANMACGYCYLNNAAIAAETLRERFGRVAILDIDVHHGNGTQEIFWRRNDVFVTSVHADPADIFPFYAGYLDERGGDDGTGANLNFPVSSGSGDEVYLGAVERACAAVVRSGAQAVVLSLGLDASAEDPFACMRVSPQGFSAMGRLVQGIGRPTLLLQEGGYLSPALGSNLRAFLDGFHVSSRVVS